MSNPAPLLRLLGPDDVMESIWELRDFPAMWTHQLGALLVNELRTIDPAWALIVAGACKSLQPPVNSFSDLFACSAPPRSVLDLVKRYAKFHMDPATAQLPRPIASGIYIESILAALSRCGTPISSMSTHDLVEHARDFASQDWVDQATRQRVLQAVEIIQSRG